MHRSIAASSGLQQSYRQARIYRPGYESNHQGASAKPQKLMVWRRQASDRPLAALARGGAAAPGIGRVRRERCGAPAALF